MRTLDMHVYVIIYILRETRLNYMLRV